jgi:hypothetical protein
MEARATGFRRSILNESALHSPIATAAFRPGAPAARTRLQLARGRHLRRPRIPPCVVTRPNSSGLPHQTVPYAAPTSANPAQIQRVANLMLQYGQLKQPLNVKQMIGG